MGDMEWATGAGTVFAVALVVAVFVPGAIGWLAEKLGRFRDTDEE